MSNLLYHCSVVNRDLSVDEARTCGLYIDGYCESLDNGCSVIAACSDLEQSAIEPGSLITHDSIMKSLRHLRMREGR